MTDTEPTFEDDELMCIVNSLSITYNSINEKLDRLNGHHYGKALEQFKVCDRTLAKVRAAATARRLAGVEP